MRETLGSIMVDGMLEDKLSRVIETTDKFIPNELRFLAPYAAGSGTLMLPPGMNMMTRALLSSLYNAGGQIAADESATGELGDLNKVIKNKNIDLVVFYLCNMQCCMSVVGDNIMKTADMVASINKAANKIGVDVIFGGLGIELLPDIKSIIKKTFITFKELNQLV